MAITFGRVTPILRIFDLPEADEFHLEFLGFQVDWDHRFDDGAPLYRQICRGDLVLHLSEHHGDGSPGAPPCRDERGRGFLEGARLEEIP
ncbi:MAG TPA: glyoxalase superfamily protein [Steroidobacteraceae bacterium]